MEKIFKITLPTNEIIKVEHDGTINFSKLFFKFKIIENESAVILNNFINQHQIINYSGRFGKIIRHNVSLKDENDNNIFLFGTLFKDFENGTYISDFYEFK